MKIRIKFCFLCMDCIRVFDTRCSYMLGIH